MAAFHSRSNSFPSREHPVIPQIEEQLSRINSSSAASSSSEVYHKINGLQDLHEFIDKLLTQKAFTILQHKKCADDALDRSLRLLDLCSIAKDALQQTKESVCDLLSAIRRKVGNQETEAKKYLASRKMVKRAIKKASENLKPIQKKSISSPLTEDHETLATLREVEAATLSVFESLLTLISGSKSNGWSLVAKLMHQKKIEEEKANNEFEEVDAALHKSSRLDEIFQDKLKNLEMCVTDLEESLESLNRRLIKTRVSLLNVLNH